ncbi:ABC transporter substrate-binding protein, partial [candidate division KSB1 bacterium]
EKKGFVLIGWAEVGYVYIFTNEPVKNLDDFKHLKIWMWEGDPVAEITFKEFEVNPIPLSVTDVLTSLQTGLINTVYTSPLACIVLQWFTKLKYVSDIPLTNSMGAVLISKRAFNKIKPEYRQIVKKRGYEYFRRLTEISRKDNATSLQKMKAQGMQTLKLSTPENLKKFQKIGDKTRQDLVGKFFDQALVDQIQQALLEFRKRENASEGNVQ